MGDRLSHSRGGARGLRTRAVDFSDHSFPFHRLSSAMLSRVADSIYWMSRYVERAENVARFLDVTYNMALDMPPASGEQWAR